MTLVETFVRADRAITEAVSRLGGAWSSTFPPIFATDLVDGVPVRDAVAHIARDEAWVPALLGGRTMAEVGADAFDGDLLGHDAVGAFVHRREHEPVGGEGVRTDLEAPVHCSFGDCPTEEYLWQLVVARTLGAEALAVVGGGPSPVDDTLAAAVLAGLAPRAALWREVGILRPARVATGPSPRDELLALAGWAGAVPCPT